MLHLPTTTKSQLAAEYLEACRRHCTPSIDTVLEQIRELPDDSIGGGTRAPRLTLAECSLSGAAAVDALESIMRKVQFRRLEIEHCIIDDEGAEALFDMTEYYESAAILSIAGPRQFGIRGWQAASRMIKKSADLTELEITDAPLEASHAPVLARSLRAYTCTLRALSLQRVCLTGEPLLCLVIALKSNSSIRELRLCDNRLGVSDAAQLASLLRYNTRIQLLDLSNNMIQDAGTAHLADALAEQAAQSPPSAAASPLSPHRCQVGGHDVRGLAFLVLWNNQLTRNCAPYLSKALRTSQSLCVLNVGRNALGSDGVRALGRGAALVSLGLQAARLGADAAQPLADLIKTDTKLQRLDLRENRLGAAGLQLLLNAMKDNSTLTQIDLDEPPNHESSTLVAEDSETALARRMTREIRAACNRNVVGTPDPPHDAAMPHDAALHRKISLTCHTACLLRQGVCGPEEEVRPRLRSPAPSPAASPAPSPAGSPVPAPHPSSRFMVTRVTPERDSSTDSSGGSTSSASSTPTRLAYCPPSRFRVVQVLEPPQIQVHPASTQPRKSPSRFSVTRNYDSVYNPNPTPPNSPAQPTLYTQLQNEVVTQLKHEANVGVQAKNLTDISAQARNLSDISAQAKNLSDIIAQAKNLTDVSAHSKILTDISAQTKNLSDISAQAKNLSDISAQAKNLSDISAQAKNLSDISVQGKNLSDISAQAKNLSHITAQSKNLSDISTQGKNLSDISAQAKNVIEVSAQVKCTPVSDAGVKQNEVNVSAEQKKEAPISVQEKKLSKPKIEVTVYDTQIKEAIVSAHQISDQQKNISNVCVPQKSDVVIVGDQKTVPDISAQEKKLTEASAEWKNNDKIDVVHKDNAQSKPESHNEVHTQIKKEEIDTNKPKKVITTQVRSEAMKQSKKESSHKENISDDPKTDTSATEISAKNLVTTQISHFPTQQKSEVDDKSLTSQKPTDVMDTHKNVVTTQLQNETVKERIINNDSIDQFGLKIVRIDQDSIEKQSVDTKSAIEIELDKEFKDSTMKSDERTHVTNVENIDTKNDNIVVLRTGTVSSNIDENTESRIPVISLAEDSTEITYETSKESVKVSKNDNENIQIELPNQSSLKDKLKTSPTHSVITKPLIATIEEFPENDLDVTDSGTSTNQTSERTDHKNDETAQIQTVKACETKPRVITSIKQSEISYSDAVKRDKKTKVIINQTDNVNSLTQIKIVKIKPSLSDVPVDSVILKKNKSESSLDSPDLEVSRFMGSGVHTSVFDSSSSLEISESSMESLNEQKSIQELDRRKSAALSNEGSLESGSEVTPINSSNLLNLSVSSNESVSPIFGKTKVIHDSLSSLEASVSSLDSTKQERLMVTSADSGIEYSLQHPLESKEDNSSNEGTLTNNSSLKESIKKTEALHLDDSASPKRTSSLLDVPALENKGIRDRIRKISWVAPSSSFHIPRPEEKEAKPSHLEKLLSIFQHPSLIFSRSLTTDDDKKVSNTPPRRDLSLSSSFWSWGSAVEKEREEDSSEATDSTLSERVQVSFVDESFSKKLDSKTPSTDTDNTLSEFHSFPTHECEMDDKVTLTTEDIIVQNIDVSLISNTKKDEKDDKEQRPRSFAAVLKSSGSENSLDKQSNSENLQSVDKLPSKVIRGIKENISPENTLTSSMSNTEALAEELEKQVRITTVSIWEPSTIESKSDDVKVQSDLAPIATMEDTLYEDTLQLAFIDDKIDELSIENRVLETDTQAKSTEIDLGRDALSYLIYENRDFEIGTENIVNTTAQQGSLAEELKEAENKEILDLSPELVIDENNTIRDNVFTAKEIIGLRTSPIIPERAKIKKSNSLENLPQCSDEKSPKAKTIVFKIPEGTTPRDIPERRSKLRTRSGSSPKSLPESLNKPCPLTKMESILNKKKKKVSSLGKIAKDSLLALNMSEEDIAEFRRSYKLTSVESLRSLESVSENSVDSRCRACLRQSQESLMSLDSISEDCRCTDDCERPGMSGR
ncbi:unnamed protein product [Spodoptera exigua]|nr:unnamed protein product [Spodoptera exigua]